MQVSVLNPEGIKKREEQERGFKTLKSTSTPEPALFLS